MPALPATAVKRRVVFFTFSTKTKVLKTTGKNLRIERGSLEGEPALPGLTPRERPGGNKNY